MGTRSSQEWFSAAIELVADEAGTVGIARAKGPFRAAGRGVCISARVVAGPSTL